jgi:hypothetical protein
MAILSKGTDFTTGDQVTAAKLDALVDSATFAAGAVDDSTTALDSSTPKKIIVKNGGISSTQLATDAVTTVKVENNAITLAKMATQADQTVLGNVSGGAAVPTAVPIVGAAGILVNSDSLGTDDTKGATQGNIKAYVDSKSTFDPATYSGGETTTLPNGLIMKFGTITASQNASTDVNFGVAFNAVVSAQLTILEDSNSDRNALKIGSLSTSTLAIRNTSGSNLTAHWLVFGR